MITYLVKRLAWMVFVLFGVMTIVFFISRVIPADPVAAMLGGQAPPELIEQVKEKWDLDKPLYRQYLIYLWRLSHGDLGISISTGQPVMEDLIHYFPATLELATAATFLSVIFGIALGIISAVKRGRVTDHLSRVSALFGISMPVFWLGLLMLLLFYYLLDWLPGAGQLPYYMARPPRVTGLIILDSLIAGRFDAFKSALKHMVMPAVVLSFFGIAAISRITRSSMLDVLREEYVTTARAKGLREVMVVMKHALKNAMLPVTTIAGITYGRLLEGSVITETIFAWPGLGRYATNAFLALDFPAVVGSTMLIALLYALTNLIVDISYAYLNPKVRYA
ncbi:TPA: ABC transporter permease [Candidatus Bipolaricaulota bacterium]|nr:ABC transporter permease [Candidatus Bipolaricaulota bacterium]